MTRDEAAGVLIARVIAAEGGVADVGDGKGITRFGQTPDWLSRFRLRAPATVVEAAQNYRVWLVRTGLIGVCDYPDSFAHAVIDWAVTSGHAVAIRALQRAVGAPVDGIYGPETQTFVDVADRVRVAKRLVADRVRFFGRIVTAAPEKHARFCAGWMNRMAAQIEDLP